MTKSILSLIFVYFLSSVIYINNSYAWEPLRAEAEVVWEGGPDLVVPFFIPPLLESEPGTTIYIHFNNANIGNIPSIESMTRFYISTNEKINPAVDRSIGSARVPALIVDELTDQRMLQFNIPSDFPPGRYYLAACADAENEVTELNEDNNCSFVKLDNYISIVLPALPVTNKAPVCDVALPSITTLWPPNHKLVDIAVSGITDPDGDPITIQVISIHQDEPVNGLGDGDTSPDGFGIGGNTAQVRAERSGLENGRVYTIKVKASDDKGLSCTTDIVVGVPHDKKDQAIRGSEQSFDSTLLR